MLPPLSEPIPTPAPAPVAAVGEGVAALALLGAGVLCAIAIALAAGFALAFWRERAIRRRQLARAARFQFIADTAPELLVHFDGEGAIAYASPAAEALLGVTPDRLAAEGLFAYVHPRDRGRLQTLLLRAGQFGQSGEGDLRLRLPDGGERPVRLRVRAAHRAVPRAGGAPRSLRNRFETVASLVEEAEAPAAAAPSETARTEAEAALRARTEFLAGFSHELRTPLNAIIGFAEMMAREMFGPLGDPRYADYAESIQRSGAHLLELINDSLDMAKIESGKWPLAPAAFAVDGLMGEVREIVGLAAQRKGLALRLGAEPGLTLHADRRAVKQILINLLSNAVKFTPEGGRIEAVIARIGAGAVIAVRDTGAGIPPEGLARLGRPFEQLAPVSPGGEPGTGLGLALVRAFAELHGGRMEVTSTLGQGTEVRVHLPHAGAVRPANEAGADPSAPDLAGAA